MYQNIINLNYHYTFLLSNIFCKRGYLIAKKKGGGLGCLKMLATRKLAKCIRINLSSRKISLLCIPNSLNWHEPLVPPPKS